MCNCRYWQLQVEQPQKFFFGHSSGQRSEPMPDTTWFICFTPAHLCGTNHCVFSWWRNVWHSIPFTHSMWSFHGPCTGWHAHRSVTNWPTDMPRRALLSGSKSSLVAERFGARYLRSHWPAAARSAATSNEVAVSARLVWHCGGDLHPGQRHHDEGALQAAEPGDALPGGGWWLHHLLHHPGLRLRHLPERPLRLRHPAELRGHPAELRGHPILLNSVDYKPLDFEMQQPPTTSGSIPLQEYRRDIPPGWTPGNPGYPLKEYFEKLRLWYRVCGLEDELIGPMIAGRLYGRASKVAMALRVRRPDGAYDVGDAALVRLAVDEVVYPNTGQVIQAHIPSGVQHLVQALRNAFGQQDHDMATQALERFFSLTRGKMSLAEYAVEFDSRMDEAHDRAGLVMNDVAKFLTCSSRVQVWATRPSTTSSFRSKEITVALQMPEL